MSKEDQRRERQIQLGELVYKYKLLKEFSESPNWKEVLEPWIKDRITTYTGGVREDGTYRPSATDKSAEVALEVAKELGSLINTIRTADKALVDVEETLKKLQEGK